MRAYILGDVGPTRGRYCREVTLFSKEGPRLFMAEFVPGEWELPEGLYYGRWLEIGGRQFFKDLLPRDTHEHFMQRINSEQTPADIRPIPFRDKRVDLIKLNAKQRNSLAMEGVHTLGQLEDWIAAQSDPIASLKALPGIGPTSSKSIFDSFQALLAQELPFRELRERGVI